MPEQETMFEMGAAEDCSEALAAEPEAPLKLKVINRNQFKMLTLDVNTLVAADHKVRAIWEITGALDLSRFQDGIRSRQGQAGREHNDPRLLVAVWVYAYSQGISSAREVSRQMEHEPGLRWLAGLEVISHTTLSNFRTDHKAGLDRLFTDLLAVLDRAGLVDLDQVMHDGTKVQAQASSGSFRREKTVGERLEQAQRVVEELGDPEDEQKQTRREAARRRAARENKQVLERAWEELQEIRQNKSGAEEKEQVRVSITEPEARQMKHGNDGGIAPSYNVQISTDAKEKVIVGVSLSQCSSDGDVELSDVVKQVEAKLGRQPVQVVADGGYTNQKNMVGLAEAGVDFIGSLPDPEERKAAARQASGIGEEFSAERFEKAPGGKALICPQGQLLVYVRRNEKRGNSYAVYQAEGSVCSQCAMRLQCCPQGFRKGRTVSLLVREKAAVAEFRKKMETEAARQAYRRRSEVAETPHAWIKEKFGIRKLRLRGMHKAHLEMLWACLAYNVMQWIRLVWRNSAPPQPQAA